MYNKLGLFFVLVVLTVSMFSFVVADTWTDDEADIKVMNVYVNDEHVWEGECTYNSVTDVWTCITNQLSDPAFERGEEADIRVTFIADTYLDEVSVRTWLTGYKDDIEDETSEFDVYEDKSYTKTLHLYIPEDADATEEYTLRVEIESQSQLSGVSRANIDALVQHKSEDLEIKYVELYAARDFCSCNVEQIGKGMCGECYVAFEAGSSLCVDVSVKNMGSHEIEDVYVSVDIPELCVYRSTYVGDLDGDDCTGDDCDDSAKETVCFTIPEDAKAGSYMMEITAEGDDAEDSVKQIFSVKAASAVSKEPSVDITLQKTSAEVEQGKGVVYNLFVANLGAEQTFVVSVEGMSDWATVQINPQAFTLEKGESQTVNVYVVANENAAAGEHVFTVKVKYGDTVKVYNFSANVKETPGVFSGLDLKTVLMVIAIVLAVIIVILLIVLLAKKNGREKVEETYY